MESSSCTLGNKNALKQLQKDIFKAIKASKGKSSPRDAFAKKIKDLSEGYKEELDAFIFEVNDFLSRSGELAYSNIGGIWTLSDIEAVAKGRTNEAKSQEPESKTSEIERDPIRSASDTFLTDVYGTSTAKDLLLRSFKAEFPGLFCIDFDTLEEISSSYQVNSNINNYLKTLFNLVVAQYSSVVNDPEFKSLQLKDLESLNKLNNYLKNYRYEYTIQNLLSLAKSKKPANVKKLKALNALFILNNFDRLLKDLLKKSIDINRGFGIITMDENKYNLNLTNSNITTTWRDDDKDIDALAEANNINRLLLESLPLINPDTNLPYSGLNLSTQAAGLTNTRIRHLMTHKWAQRSIDIIPGSNLYNELEAIETGFYEKYLLKEDGMTTKSLSDLISDFFDDAVKGARVLYSVLQCNNFNLTKYGLFKDDRKVIKSMFRGIFDPHNSKSFYSIYLNTIKKVDTTENPNKYFYTYLTQFLDTQEMIESLEYERTNGKISNKTLIDNNRSVKTYQFDNELSGKFNLEREPNFTHFGIDDKGLDVLSLIEDPKNTLEINPYIDIVIPVDLISILRIRKFGKTNKVKIFEEVALPESSKVISAGEALNQAKDMLREVTGYTFNDAFLNALFELNSNSPELLFNMVGNILYNYSLSRYLNKAPKKLELGKTLLDWYRDKVSYYFDEKSVPSVSNKQLPYLNDLDTPIKIDLVRTKNILNNVITENTQKDAEGKLMTTTGLDQIATKVKQQYRRSNSLNKALANFTLNKVIRGQEFARDFKGPNGNKAATAFTEAENFIGGFLYDYLDRLSDVKNTKEFGLIKLMPSVISDKSRIMKTVFDLNELSPYTDADGKPIPFYALTTEQFLELATKELGDYYESIYLNLKQNIDVMNHFLQLVILNTNLFDQVITNLNSSEEAKTLLGTDIISKELLANYLVLNPDDDFKTINNLLDIALGSNKDSFIKKVLHKVSNKVEIARRNLFNSSDLSNLNFYWKQSLKGPDAYNVYYELLEYMLNHPLEFGLPSDVRANEILQALIASDLTYADIENTIKTKLPDAKLILHTINLDIKNIANNIELTQNIHYTLRGGIHGNALLFDLLYRWGKISESHAAYTSYNLQEGYGKAENFFKKKLLQYVSDLLKDNCEIRTNDSFFNDLSDPAISKLRSLKWIVGENVMFAKLHYNYVNSEGSLQQGVLKITDKDSFRDNYIYKLLMKQLYKNPGFRKKYGETISIDNPNFNFTSFIEAVQELNSLNSLKGKIYSELKLNIQEIVKIEDPVVKETTIKSLLKEIVTDDFVNEIKESGKIPNILKSDLSTEVPSSFKMKDLNNVIKKSIDVKTVNLYNLIDVSLEMNPELEKYQSIDFLLSSEYINATVGTHINHPGKGKTLIEKESAAWGQQVKRNVSLTASKHKFALNLLDGIKSKQRIAIIEDDKDFVCSVTGITGSVKPFDGATFCSIVTNYLENNSLKGDSAGIDKKLFVHDYKANSGTGIIIKTAGFSLTNGRIRNSEFLERMNKKLLGIQFTDIDGHQIYPDITKDFNGNNIVKSYGDIVYKLNNNIYKVDNITYSNGITTIERSVLTNDGWIKESVPVKEALKTNYDVWEKVFGGAYSISLHTDNINNATLDKTEYSFNENSCLQLTYAVNHVGNKLNDNVEGQDDVDQYMKRALIDYIVTEGAIKQGAANVNSKEAYFDDTFQLTTMELGMYDAGIQLDAEHHADNSVLSLMTLVLNALGARGYSSSMAADTYAALRSLTREALSGFNLGIEGLKNGDSEPMLNFIADIITKAIITTSETDGNLIQALSREIKKAYSEGDKVTYDLILKNMPISNPGTFDKMVSLLASLLTKKCVRIKFPGSMDVLSPSNRIYKLFNNHLRGYYQGNLEVLPELSDPIDLHKVLLGRTYRITYTSDSGIEASDVLVEDPRDYFRIKELYKQGLIVSILENIKVGRDLASYNVFFLGNDGVQYNIWDIDSVKDLYLIDKRMSSIISNIKDGKSDSIQFDLLEMLKLIEEVTALGFTGDPSPRNVHNFLIKRLQQSLNGLSEGGEVIIDGKPVQVTAKEVIPYELIMTKIYESTFGLKAGDDVQEISQDKYFFLRRFYENWKSKVTTNNYDVELKTLDGNHVYLLYDVPENLGVHYKKLDIDARYDGDELYQYDSQGKKIRKLSSEQDEIWSDGTTEIIVSKNLGFYVANTHFMNIGLSRDITDEAVTAVIDQLKDSDKRSVLGMLDGISGKEDVSKVLLELDPESDEYKQLIATIVTNSKNNIEETSQLVEEEIETLNEALIKGNVEEVKFNSKVIRNLIFQGKEVHTSFLKSLKVLAARIPAQSHLSFMAMKVVGFDDSGKNTAYVNRMQIWLQGSDYDIDKVSLLGYKFRNGKFIKWSNLMNLSDVHTLKASETLPFPTGKELAYGEEPNETFTAYELRYNNALKHSAEKIGYAAKLIRIANELGYIPSNDLNTIDMINKHNLYLLKEGINSKDALINFISTSMYNISADPINLVQGQAPIDDATDRVKDTAKEMPMSVKSKFFAPGSPQTKMELLILTLTGKENTGIVASAMKNFEACSLYYYKILNSGNTEEQNRLLINKTIFGKNISLLANAYAKNTDTVVNETVKEALNSVDNDEDAFILFSALLSLSTDNAKDPVLAKINAGPKLMSLYTAGLMMGFDIDTLVSIMTSRFGWAINDMLQSNVFNDTQGIFNIDGIFSYLQLGPIKDYKSLPALIKTILKLIVINYKKNKTLNSKKTFKEDEVDDAYVMRVICSPRFNIESYLNGSNSDLETEKNNVILDQIDYLKYKFKLVSGKKDTEKNRQELALIAYKLNVYLNLKEDDVSEEIKKLALDGIKIDELAVSETDLDNTAEEIEALAKENKNIKEVDINEQAMKLNKLDFTEKAGIRLRRFLKAVRKYKRFSKIAKNTYVKSPFDGLLYLVKDVLKSLNFVANELARLRPILSLNQSLPNTLGDLLKFLRSFESIFLQRIGELNESNDLKDFKSRAATALNDEDLKISFNQFVTDAEYRQKVINLYDEIKQAVNIFDVMANSDHYFGYMEAVNALISTGESTSKIYKVANEVSERILTKYMVISKSGKIHDNAIKRTKKFVVNKLNNQFLLSKDVRIIIPASTKEYDNRIFDTKGNLIEPNNTPIILGTPSGNASFKRWMEESVLKALLIGPDNFAYNPFIQDLIKVKTNRTHDFRDTINLSLNSNMMPKSESERAEFKVYKDALSSLTYKFNGIPIMDLFFYYNLIAYNGESGQQSFTSLFEDIYAEKSSQTASDYIEFYSTFDKEGLFKLDVDYTEDELLQYIAPKENPERAKLPYIRVYNPKTMEIELAYKDKSLEFEDYEGDNLELLELMRELELQLMENEEEGESSLESKGLTLEERLANFGYKLVDNASVDYPRYFTNGFIEEAKRLSLSGKISLIGDSKIIIKGKEYSLSELVQIGKNNKHDVKEDDIIIKAKSKEGTRVDVALTLFNINKLLEPNPCK